MGFVNRIRTVHLANKAEAELAGYQKTERPQLLDSAIAGLEQLVLPEFTPPGEPAAAGRHFRLADALRMRYESLEDAADLDRALRHAEIAVALPPATDDVRVGSLLLHATILYIKANGSDAPGDVAAALAAFDLARAAVPESGFPMRDVVSSAIASQSAVMLAARFRHTGDVADLEEARIRSTAALEGEFFSEADADAALSNLALVLGDLAELRADLDLAEQAVTLGERLVDVAGLPAARRSTLLANLARFRELRYELGGDLADLTAAADAAAASTESLAPDDHAAVALVRLNTLAAVLMRRYEAERSLDDLERVKVLFNHVVRHPATPEADRRSALTNLAWAFRTHYGVTGEVKVLDDALVLVSYAIAKAEEQADGVDPDDPSFRWTLDQLGVLLRLRYEATGDVEDLEAAETAGRRASNGSLHDPVEHGGHAVNLATIVQARIARGLEPDEHRAALDETVTLLRAGLAVTAGGPDRVGVQANLADALIERHALLGDGRDLAEALALCRDASASTAGTPQQRVRAARTLGMTAPDPHDALQAYRRALDVLRDAVHPAIERAAREAVLHEHRGLAVEAASKAIAAGDPSAALELLERGRGVLWSQSLRFTADLARLRVEHHELAEDLLSVHVDLDRLATSGPTRFGGADSRADLRRALSTRRTSLLEHIRGLRGFESFQRLPDAAALAGTGSRGTVIVLVIAEQRCDALVVDGAGVRSAPLPVTREDVHELAAEMLTTIDDIYDPESAVVNARKTFAAQLSRLYDAVAGPALDAAGIPSHGTADDLPRVWWCPTGVLGLLPVHLAGTHTGTGNAVIDRVVSSYTPTVRELLARGESQVDVSWDDVLVVNPPHLEGTAELEGAGAEARDVVDRFPHARALVGEQATADRVLDALSTVSWAHFACHGVQDLDNPSQAGLVLKDRALSFDEIAAAATRPGAAVVFSACDTARGGLPVLDEALTLVAAARFAGFEHVVGSLYSAHDLVTAQVMARFYTALSAAEPGTDRVARALHAAVLAVRADQRGRAPDTWGGLVHVGW
ncbi:hypothetical protein ADK67_31820 [Saccharothrix sp. NRRL B-16348]|uniref:CHAT domain-containing protein n=1 Tax=Saccharothrix sp. NRRL B-16348 TaxID=1415542 RepID=UPI0006AFAD8D|nr:CHAT domain-containing protein [Saccharothrix sp. NRRL B-16348]KOX20108.1 hypothetical protein ADK67_31820 [Saccharothrix sp. NRRL B-16348]